MEKCSRKLLLIILLLQMQFASIGVSFADQSSTETVNKPIAEVIVSDDMLRVFSEKIDDIFPITVQKEFFDQPAQDLYSDVGRETMVRIGTDEGVQNIILFVNQDGIHEYTGGVDISGSYQTNFMATIDVTVNDAYPDGQAGCFIGFKNYGISAFSEDESLDVILSADRKNAGISIKGKGTDSRYYEIISELSNRTNKLTVIHFMKHTFFFLNGEYAGQFHDGKTGPFQIYYGAAAFKNGETADCSFDDLVIRKVSNAQ